MRAIGMTAKMMATRTDEPVVFKTNHAKAMETNCKANKTKVEPPQ